MRKIDLIGQTFGHLTVIKEAKKLNKRTAWLCQCDCGKQVIVATKYLRNGHTISCGHVKADRNHTVAPGYEAKRVNGVATFLLDKKRKLRTDNSTGITGVKKVKYKDGTIHYSADITINKKRTHIGTFDTIKEAKQARKQAENELIPKKE
ncbi:hypothetical protein [Paucilactobacillus sp. N302-9]